jgi:hypothetical protein
MSISTTQCLNAMSSDPTTAQEKVSERNVDLCDLQWQGLGCGEIDHGPPEGGNGGGNELHCENHQLDDHDAVNPLLDYHGAPRFSGDVHVPRSFRDAVRCGSYTGPTNAVCPGFLQCNLVVLSQGQYAFDFLLFCQRNPKACPLIEVCDVGSYCPRAVAPGADLRTDVPR